MEKIRTSPSYIGQVNLSLVFIRMAIPFYLKKESSELN
jgi:hypothetical protein